MRLASSRSDANPCGCIVLLAYVKVGLLLTGARFAEGDAPDLHNRMIGARVLRLDSHLARPQLRRRKAREDVRRNEVLPSTLGAPREQTHLPILSLLMAMLTVCQPSKLLAS